MKTPIDKKFVSEADKFLEELRKTTPESTSQAFERQKYARISALRDGTTCPPARPPKIWDKF